MLSNSAQIVGTVCIDLIPMLFGPPSVQPGTVVHSGPIRIRAGGPVANVSKALKELGAPVSIAANIGDDDLSGLLKRLVQRDTGLADQLTEVPGVTGSYSVMVQPPGSDRTYWHHIGANTTFDGSGVNPGLADLLHLGYPSHLPALMKDTGAGLRQILADARAVGTTTSLDLSYVDPSSDAASIDWGAILDQTLRHVDVLTPSIDDLSSALRREPSAGLDAARALALELVERGAGLVMVTAGEAGMVLATNRRSRLLESRLLAHLADGWSEAILPVAAHPIHAVDTGSAGDNAAAGLLYGILAGFDLITAGHLAASTAAIRIAGAERLHPYGNGSRYLLAPDR